MYRACSAIGTNGIIFKDDLSNASPEVRHACLGGGGGEGGERQNGETRETVEDRRGRGGKGMGRAYLRR